MNLIINPREIQCLPVDTSISLFWKYTHKNKKKKQAQIFFHNHRKVRSKNLIRVSFGHVSISRAANVVFELFVFIAVLGTIERAESNWQFCF